MAAEIVVERIHPLGKTRSRQVVEDLAESLAKDLKARYHWSGDELTFHRSGARGRILVADDRVRVEVSLGLLLSPLRGKIEGEIRERLGRLLPDEARTV